MSDCVQTLKIILWEFKSLPRNNNKSMWNCSEVLKYWKVKKPGIVSIYIGIVCTSKSSLFFLVIQFFLLHNSPVLSSLIYMFITDTIWSQHRFQWIFNLIAVQFLANFERFWVKHQRQVLICWQQRQLDWLQLCSSYPHT